MTYIYYLLIILFLSGCATAPYRPTVGVITPPGVYHIVGSGQNLYRISKIYGVSINEIMRANNLSNPNQIGVGEKLLIPRAQNLLYLPPIPSLRQGPIEEIVGEKQRRVQWRTITLHHSATTGGNAEIFDRDHRRRHMGGLFYHFVIGNGKGSGDGEIEVGWRWKRQKEVNRRRDIQICLVGDFNRQQVSEAQFNSLVGLIKVLQRQYNIGVSGIRMHKEISGATTECAGSHFPYERIVSALRTG